MTHRDGFPRLSGGVAHGLRCPASPAAFLLPGGSPARSLWVNINNLWYNTNHPIFCLPGLGLYPPRALRAGAFIAGASRVVLAL